jgi:integrase/recombinase XerC
MPRPSKPWFRTNKGAWYVKVRGKQTALGVKGLDKEAEAVRAWHRLLGGLPLACVGETPLESGPWSESHRKPRQVHETPQAVPTVAEVVSGFLSDVAGRACPGTVRNYRIFLLPFSEQHGTKQAEALTDTIAEAYARKPEWSATYRNGFLASLVSAYRWAKRTGLIAVNPLGLVRKPPKASRGAKALISAADHERLCKAAKPMMRAFLKLLWLTGARPGEIAGLTANEINLAKGVAILSDHKTAHLGKVRVVFLCPEAVKILRSLCVKYKAFPSGLLFPGHEGATEKMTPQVIDKRLQRLCKKAGVKCFAYGYRHTFATAALSNGVPDAQVAALLGHSSTTMLHKHYSHLTSQSQALREALGRVR